MTVSAQPVHPVVACADVVLGALAEVRDVQAVLMTTSEKKAALIRLARIKARTAELEARVLAAAADVAEETGSRDVALWLAHETRDEPARTRADLSLATALEARTGLSAALRDGVVNVAQARVIVEATSSLPDHLGPAIKDDAEARLVGFAADFGPRELKRLGAHILDVVAPEIAEAEDAMRLASLEENARTRSSVRSRSIGEGMSRTTWVHPTIEADHLEALRMDLAAATVTGHGQTHDLTAEQTRRLACSAQILPAVFGGKSQIIDAGRTRRLFSAVQRTLIQQQWVTCIGEGCTVPAEWCDLHHLTDPWAHGGNTDLADGGPGLQPAPRAPPRTPPLQLAATPHRPHPLPPTRVRHRPRAR